VLGTDDVLRLQQEAEQLRNKVRKCYLLVCSGVLEAGVLG
jgi:hypothetical protein